MAGFPPPPLLRTWPAAVQVLLAGVVPAASGLACGALLGESGAAFLALPVVAVAGELWAGAEHATPRAGAARGLLGGALFGAALLAGHELAPGPDHGLLPDPAGLQLAITSGAGTLVGWVGASARRGRDVARTTEA